VRIDHSAQHEASYAHCAEGSIRVKAGDTVNAWTQICNVGMTGKTSWPHVHLVIKKDGVHDKIHNYFDPSLFSYCKFCKATNDPMAKIRMDSAVAQIQEEAANPVPDAGNSVATVADATKSANALGVVLVKISKLPPQLFTGILAVLVGILFFVPRSRNAVVVGGLICVAILFTSEIPVSNIRASTDVAGIEETQAETESSNGMGEKEAFEIAYNLLSQPGFEGRPGSCTNDGAYTKSGVTQGAYNAYRRRHGLPTADVCQSLTEAERKAIAYEDFWLKSGSHKLPYPLNIVHFDFSFNAGSEPGGPPSQILAQSNGDVNLYNQLRVEWYKTRRTCSLYCNGWINRVNKLQAFIQEL
jgi:lysozyme family protein